MKLASLRQGGRDGSLVVVSRELSDYVTAGDIAPTLQWALEHWDETSPRLAALYQMLIDGNVDAQPLDVAMLAAPLPRAYQWLDGSAYLSHVVRVRKARGADMPPSFLEDPLMYQGGSDHFLGPVEPISLADETWGCDFEGEVAVVVDDVPQGVTEAQAERHIQLLMLVNDVSLRNLIPAEVAKGFGFIHGKPPTAFSPVAVSVDELGEAWRDTKVHLPLIAHLNGGEFGHPNAGKDMQFGFGRLISHAAKTRPLAAGTIIGSGTVSNVDQQRGGSCLVEKRVIEIIEKGEASTPFLGFGDRVRIEMFNADGQSIFGAIDQTVQPCRR